MPTPLVRPNIIWIMTDDQEVDVIDDPQALPFLTSKPQGSWVRLINATLSSPLCGVSRANLLSGRRTDHHGIKGNDDTQQLVAQEPNLLPVWMAAAGYRTGLIGKYENDWPYALGNYVPQGWSYFLGEKGASGYYNYTLIRTDASNEVHGSTSADYETDVLNTAATAFVQGVEPFFLLWTPGAPHGPIEPAPRHQSLSGFTITDALDLNEADLSGTPPWLVGKPLLAAGALSAARTEQIELRKAMRSIDEGINNVFDALIATGRINNTIFVMQTDNGRPMGRKRIAANDNGLQKRVPYYYSSDASLTIRYPGATQRIETGLVRSLDLTATVAAWASATPNIAVDGTDITPLILNGTAVHEAIENRLHGNGEVASLPPWWSVRTLRWKYNEWATTTNPTAVDHVELYDMLNDPAEMENVAEIPANAAVRSNMSSMLEQLKVDSQSLVISMSLGRRSNPAGQIRRYVNVSGTSVTSNRKFKL